MILNPSLCPGQHVVSLAGLARAEERVAKLARRAKRLGMAEPKLVELGACAWRVRDDLGFKHVVRGMVVAIEGERPVLPGHKLLGTVEPVQLADGSAEYLVFAAPGAERELSGFAGNGCDHCKTKRARKLLVLVEREADGAVLRVGRECVQSYLPGVSVEQLVESASYHSALGSLDDEESWDHCAGVASPGLFVSEFLAQCFAVVRVDGGFKPAAMAEDSTRSVAEWMIDTARRRNVSENDRRQAERYRVQEEDLVLADAALDYARKLEPRDDFQRNVRIAALAEYLNPRRAGLVAAIVPAFNRELVRRAPKVEKVSEYVGEIGKRQVFKGLLVKVAYPIETMYGDAVIYVFEDEVGHALKWKASGRAKLQKGWKYDIKGSVKAHDEYKGQKQTVLARCAVEAEYEPVEARAAREMREKALAEKQLQREQVLAEFVAAREECGCHNLRDPWDHPHSDRCRAAHDAIQRLPY